MASNDRKVGDGQQKDDKNVSPQKRKTESEDENTTSASKLMKTDSKGPVSMTFGKKPPGISMNLGGVKKPGGGISMNIGGKKTPVAPIKMSLSAQSQKVEQSVVKPKCDKVASVFNPESDSDEEEMPFEAKMRMRNVGRETPTAAGPNSFGKGNLGFCDRNKMIERDLKKQMEQLGNAADKKFDKT
ncbi:PEST proteolytic signal-containing nuclear protein-like isoform X2 [Mya arenaria]|uniref:PEST proteolytic signal-containing nuclear protein-like isoform X2 n=1 Tax=Mya arenaria TaxID=6604 RepID=UPI0022E47391|nr:PEST proteolytic signal-containing nuclear protein-like isoform X2 [Mya arenaria]